MHQKIVIIDSNFVLLPFQFKIDYFNEIRLLMEGQLSYIIFRQILDELEAKKIREPKSTKFIQQFDSGMSYIEKNKIIHDIIPIEEIKNKRETTDNFLIRKAIELKNQGHHVFLATNDSELRKKARELKINTIFLRQKKYLSVERA
ncbi:MAG: type II toxin-antitoxin system VapC family toxin [Promethearchaeota archaeon]|jgi:rRNA-processing protein FCF1